MHFGIPKGAKMSLALNELEWVASHSNSNTTSKHVLQVERLSFLILYAKQPMENHRGQLLSKKFH